MNYKFKYFLNHEKNARYIDEHCEICGNSNWCLNGTYFNHHDDEVESICMDCLVQGKVVVEFPSFLYDRIYNDIKKEKSILTEEEIKEKINNILQILEKTPPVPWIQCNDWPVCCADFMTYLGELTRDDLKCISDDGDGKALLLSLLDDETKNRIDNIDYLLEDLGEYVIAYHFKCMKCDKQFVVLQSF